MSKSNSTIFEAPKWATLDAKRARLREAHREAESLVVCAQDEFVDAIQDFAVGTPSAVRDDVVNDLYWNLPEVSASVLAEAFGFTSWRSMINKTIRPFYDEDLRCPTCDIPLKITSRSNLKEKQGSKRSAAYYPATGIYGLDCDACRNHKLSGSREEWNSEKAAQERRRIELRTMPYHRYLQSPEWQARRARHLRRASYRCQICYEADTVLDLHHRTYERRGDELNSDLLVLCRTCHERHHVGGEE